MYFNEKQSNEINDFMMKYSEDSAFRNKIQQLYDENTYKLSLIQIYTLEEILRYGTKKVFHKFLNIEGSYSNEQAIELYDTFTKLLNDDSNFRQYKMQQLKTAPETLSKIEIFAFSLISGSKDYKKQMHKEMTDELEYDPYNPILYDTDQQMKETLENLFFGEFIHRILELPSMKPIKVRQRENGQIANIDKPFIIEKIRNVVFQQDSISQLNQIIDSRFVTVKMNILLGKGIYAFEQYLKFNTNISSQEILGKKQEDYSENIYDFFTDGKKEKRKK